MAAAKNTELILELHRRLFDERDMDVLDDFFASDFVSHSAPPGLTPDIAGIKAFFAMFHTAFPDISVQIDELVADADRVAVATTISGTHQGELMGVAPTGRKVSVAGLDIVRIADGLVVEHRGLTDTVGLMRQLTGSDPKLAKESDPQQS